MRFKAIIRDILFKLPIYKDYIKIYKAFGAPSFIFSFKDYLKTKIHLRKFYWQKSSDCILANPHLIYVGKNVVMGKPFSYIQGAGKIYVGDYTMMGPNVGLISTNHDLYDPRKSNKSPIIIGDYSWIGMGSVITAGVHLGPKTIVGANSIVTKSFPEGYCVIAGNPAKIIKRLDPTSIDHYVVESYYGYISETQFIKRRNDYFSPAFLEWVKQVHQEINNKIKR